MQFTKPALKRLTLPEGKSDQVVFDDDLPGFGLRMRSGGKRTWIAQYRIGAKQRRLSLGSANIIDLDEARRRAKTALSQVNLGIDPQTTKIGIRVQASITLQSTAEQYLVRWAAERLKPNNFADVCRYLRVHWSTLHETSLQSVTRAMVAARLAEIASERGPYSANRARAALSALFSWAIGEGFADANPVAGTNKPIDETSRDRVLAPEELKLAWQCAGSGAYAAILRLLILTGQRRAEVGGMLWSELDLKQSIWRIRPDRTKNGLPHDVPLSGAAIDILRKQPRDKGRDLIFGSGEGPFSGWSNSKSSLDERMTKNLQEKTGSKAKLKPWRLHDMRRTVATRLGDLGTLPHVVEAILNHISGHRAGVAGIYNRAAYAAEKRAALDAWAEVVVPVGSDASA